MGNKVQTMAKRELAIPRPKIVVPDAVKQKMYALIEASPEAVELLDAMETCNKYYSLLGMPIEEQIKDTLPAAVLDALGKAMRPLTLQAWAEFGYENPYKK
jgi:hypothetical protein